MLKIFVSTWQLLSTYKYATKLGENGFLGSDHTNLEDVDSPKTKKCIITFSFKSRSEKSERPKPKNPKHLIKRDVHDFFFPATLN